MAERRPTPSPKMFPRVIQYHNCALWFRKNSRLENIYRWRLKTHTYFLPAKGCRPGQRLKIIRLKIINLTQPTVTRAEAASL